MTYPRFESFVSPEHRSVPAIVGAGVALGALFYALVWSAGGLGINLVLVQAVFVGVVYLLSRYTGHGLARQALVPAAFSLAFAAAFAVFASPLSLAVAMVGFLVSQATFVLYAVGHHADFHHPFLFLHSAFMVPVHAVTRLTVFRHLPLPRAVPSGARPVIVGLCVLVPVLFVFGSLFASADPLFGQYFSGMFDVDSFPVWIQHVVATAFWSCAFAAIFGLAFWKRETFASHARPEPGRQTESIVVLGGVIALFSLFIVFQATYLFGGEAAFQATGYTFSEYARRGFDELVAVATIVLLLFLSLRYFHGDRARGALRALQGVLFGETLLILASAVIRMNLYVDAYGYTPARLFTYWFLAAVAALLVLAFVHALRGDSQPRFMRHGLVITGIFALGFILSAPDAMSFRLNAERIARAGQIDARDVIESSAEAYPTMVLLESGGVTLANVDEGAQEDAHRAVSSFYPSEDWRHWNWSKSRLGRRESFPWFGCITAECDAAAR